MKKRLLVVSLAAAMLASMIAGCGGDTGSAGSTACLLYTSDAADE